MKNRIFAIEVSAAKGAIILASDKEYDEDAVKELPFYLDHAEYVKKDFVLGWIKEHAKDYFDCFADCCQFIRDFENMMEE